MSVKFSIYKTPKPRGREGHALQHARVITQGTKRMEEICAYINESSSLTSADIKGTIEALFNYISVQLLNGYNVDLEGFGHFSLSLRSKPMVNNKNEESTAVSIHGIHFKCSKRLKQRIVQGELRKKTRRIPQPLPIEERQAKLIEYLHRHGYINGTLYGELIHCSRYYANKDIQHYLEEGLIERIGKNKHQIYLLPSAKKSE